MENLNQPGPSRPRTLPLTAIVLIGVVALIAFVFLFFYPMSPTSVADSETEIEAEIENPSLLRDPQERAARDAMNADRNALAASADATGTPGRPSSTQPPQPTPTMIEDPQEFVATWGRRVSEAFVVAWAEAPNLLEHIVAATDSIVLGADPMRHLKFLRPVGRFEVSQEHDGRVYLSSTMSTRYRDVLGAIEDLDIQQAAEAFRLAEPYLDRSYRAQGYPDGHFRTAVFEAILVLLSTPEIEEPVELIPGSVTYSYADEELEALDPAQRLLLRLPAPDRQMIRRKLKELERALTGLPLMS
jgi:hypothetical protein